MLLTWVASSPWWILAIISGLRNLSIRNLIARTNDSIKILDGGTLLEWRKSLSYQVTGCSTRIVLKSRGWDSCLLLTCPHLWCISRPWQVESLLLDISTSSIDLGSSCPYSAAGKEIFPQMVMCQTVTLSIKSGGGGGTLHSSSAFPHHSANTDCPYPSGSSCLLPSTFPACAGLCCISCSPPSHRTLLSCPPGLSQMALSTTGLSWSLKKTEPGPIYHRLHFSQALVSWSTGWQRRPVTAFPHPISTGLSGCRQEIGAGWEE